MSFLYKNYTIVQVAYLFIRRNKTKFFLWNTNNTDKNDVNKQKKHTKYLEKHNIGKWGGGSNYEPGCFWSCFLTVQEKQVMTATLSWTWDLSRNRNKLGYFW